MTFWRLIKVLLGIEPKPIEDVPSYLAGPGTVDSCAYHSGTRRDQVLAALTRASGTARQLSTRMDLKLSIVRTNLTVLHKEGLIKDTGKDVGQGRSAENIWEAVE